MKGGGVERERREQGMMARIPDGGMRPETQERPPRTGSAQACSSNTTARTSKDAPRCRDDHTRKLEVDARTTCARLLAQDLAGPRAYPRAGGGWMRHGPAGHASGRLRRPQSPSSRTRVTRTLRILLPGPAIINSVLSLNLSVSLILSAFRSYQQRNKRRWVVCFQAFSSAL